MDDTVFYAPRSVSYFARYLSSMLGLKCHWLGSPVRRAKKGILFGLFLEGVPMLEWTARLSRAVERLIGVYIGWDIVLLEKWRQGEHWDQYKKVMRNLILATDGTEDMAAELGEALRQSVYTIPLPPPKAYALRPFPLGEFEIGCRQSPSMPEKYHLSLILEVARREPQRVFHIHHPGGYDKPIPGAGPNVVVHREPIEDMDAFLSRITCALRFTDMDTQSISSMETMMAGRYVITNRWMPYCLHTAPTTESIRARLRQVDTLRIQYPEGDKEASTYYHQNHNKEALQRVLDYLWKE